MGVGTWVSLEIVCGQQGWWFFYPPLKLVSNRFTLLKRIVLRNGLESNRVYNPMTTASFK